MEEKKHRKETVDYEKGVKTIVRNSKSSTLDQNAFNELIPPKPKFDVGKDKLLKISDVSMTKTHTTTKRKLISEPLDDEVFK